MKKMISGVFATILIGTANMAMAADCVWPYVGLVGGATISGGDVLDLSTGYAVGAVGGVEYCNARIEGEITYRKSDIDNVGPVKVTGDISVLSYMLNGYYEFDVDSKKWRPYVGGGAGFATASTSSLTSSGVAVSDGASDTRFAYQGIGGIGYFLTPHLVLDASYRYFSTLKYQLDKLDTSYTVHNMMLGARYRF